MGLFSQPGEIHLLRRGPRRRKELAVVHKAAGGAFQYPGIQILLVRREFDEMENTLILPMLRLLPPEAASYNRSSRVLTFCNGSTVKFGNLPGYGASVDRKSVV